MDDRIDILVDNVKENKWQSERTRVPEPFSVYDLSKQFQ